MGLFDKPFPRREYAGPPAWLLPPDARQPADAKAATRTLRLFGAAVFVLVVGAVFAFTVTRERHSSSSTSDTVPTASASGATIDSAVGPLSGTDVGTYLDTRKQALAGATGDRVAVVSFDGYKSEAEARAVSGSVTVDALLAAAPGGHPSVVTSGLDAWAKTQRQADQVERDEIRKLLPTVDDAAFKSFYESEVVRLDKAIANASPTSSVVFGFVVRGSADALRALATGPGVRLVDIGQGPQAAPGAVFRGLRPEETAKAGQPATRPL